MKTSLSKTSTHCNITKPWKTTLFKTNHHRALQPTLSKTIHHRTIHSNKTPLETMHFRTIFLHKTSETFFSLKQAFPTSFDTVGNMSGKYTICLDPTVPPVQHTRHKVPIHYKEEIEKTLKEMEQLEIITPVTRPTEWVSSITNPTKPDGSLRICLYPCDLNKTIIREHYKAPTLEEISHQLSGTRIFSKLDAKNEFWQHTFGHSLLLSYNP